jgi:hypothetical protein
MIKRKRKSGQILIIVAFVIALLLLSSELYILDVGKYTSETNTNSIADFNLAIRLGSLHVGIGSLANVSNGGQANYLALNLQKWSSFVEGQSQFGQSILAYSLEQAAPYVNGVRLFWGINGTGVSSVCANLMYALAGLEGNVSQSYLMNVTTTLSIVSTYKIIGANQTLVSVHINLLNEAQPAVARQITVFYGQLGNWQSPSETDQYSLVDYGNGTYFASFTPNVFPSNTQVSVHALDARGVYVQANVTSVQG